MSLLNNISGKGEHKGGLKQLIELTKPALHLTPDQDEKINTIIRKFREERKEVKSEGGDNMREEMRTARKETMQKIKDVLNDDQKKTFEENIIKWRDEVK